MKTFLRAIALLAIIGLPAAGQQRQTENAFNWNGRVPAGRWIRVKNLNGGITVVPTDGDNIQVTATKTWRRGDPSIVHFTSMKLSGSDDMLICALWGDNSRCDEHGYSQNDHNDRNDRRTNNNDVSVEFRVMVPRGVKVDVETVNGGVSVSGVTAEVHSETVNGDVVVATTGGRVNAESVNGNVRAQLGRIDTSGDMKFETVNGNVIVEFTGEFGGDVDLETVNGSLNTNFEMTVSGRLDPKHLRAHIGRAGGPRIKLETVNGNVELRKR
jgi:hypothetical protein